MPEPRIPLKPASKSLDPVVARFSGWLVGFRSSPKGYTQIVINVDNTNKYDAMRLTDFPGIVDFEVRQTETSEMPDGLDDELLKALELSFEAEGD